MPFENPITGGQGALVRPKIKSPNFVSGSTGWSINQDGSAEFNNVVIRNGQIVSGAALFYSGTPALGNLVASIAATGGTDSVGNVYPSGITMFAPDGSIVRTYQGAYTAPEFMVTDSAVIAITPPSQTGHTFVPGAVLAESFANGDTYLVLASPTDSTDLTDDQSFITLSNRGTATVVSEARVFADRLWSDAKRNVLDKALSSATSNTVGFADDGVLTGNRFLSVSGDIVNNHDAWTLDYDGKMQWGPGTGTTLDTNLYRTAAATLKTDNNLTVAGDLQASGRLTGIRELSQSSTAGVTLTTSYADITGATLTFTTAKANTTCLVTIVADASWGGGLTVSDTIVVTINTDGTDDNSKSAIIVATGSSFNGAAFSITCTYVVTLAAAGSHTIKMRGKRTASGAGSGNANINVPQARGATIPGGTTLTILVLGG